MLRLLHLCLFVLEEDSTGLDSNTAEHFSDTCNASCLSCHFYNQATTEMIVKQSKDWHFAAGAPI